MAAFVVPDSRLVGCGVFSIDKIRHFRQENSYYFRKERWKINGILFTEIGNLCLIYQILTTYL